MRKASPPKSNLSPKKDRSIGPRIELPVLLGETITPRKSKVSSPLYQEDPNIEYNINLSIFTKVEECKL